MSRHQEQSRVFLKFLTQLAIASHCSLSKDYRKMRSQSDSGEGEEDMDLEKVRSAKNMGAPRLGHYHRYFIVTPRFVRRSWSRP